MSQLVRWFPAIVSDGLFTPAGREDKAGWERLAQYILRHPFSEEKMIYNREQKQVIYHSKFSNKSKRNFEIFEAGEFIAAITQHIPEKGLQLVRYYGWYKQQKPWPAGQATETGPSRNIFRRG